MNNVGFAATIKEEAGFLKYEGYQSLYVMVASTARDGGKSGGNNSTKLMPGMVLGKRTTGGLYSHYDTDAINGTQNEEDCVILLEIIDDISDGNQQAHVGVGGVIRRDQLRFNLAADKTGFETDAHKAPFDSI